MSREERSVERLMRWLIPLFLIGFAAIAIYYSTTFKKMPEILKRGIQPSDFPQLICGLIIFLTVLMVWLDPIKVSERMTKKTWFTLVALIGFVLLVQIDLFLALGVFAGGLSAMWGERQASRIAVVSLVMPIITFLLFDLVFRIRFPHGLLTSLWYG